MIIKSRKQSIIISHPSRYVKLIKQPQLDDMIYIPHSQKFERKYAYDIFPEEQQINENLTQYDITRYHRSTEASNQDRTLDSVTDSTPIQKPRPVTVKRNRVRLPPANHNRVHTADMSQHTKKFSDLMNKCDVYHSDSSQQCQPIIKEFKNIVNNKVSHWLNTLRTEEERYIDHVRSQMGYRVCISVSDTSSIHSYLSSKIVESQELKYSVENRNGRKYVKRMRNIQEQNPKFFHYLLLTTKRKKQASQIRHAKSFSQQQNKDLARYINFSDFIGFN